MRAAGASAHAQRPERQGPQEPRNGAAAAAGPQGPAVGLQLIRDRGRLPFDLMQ